ncbi:polysaccharide pyruvyl transferase family protein [Pontibacillus salipaludis]|uniref:polysaccharide pyruvyl transferase family protein n=1 Tax=Pontibacillus salipaludis TaxID=1697394 RepID=UPI0031EFA193
MKKVGIITLNGYKNYGNRLQNYALQETIKSVGYSVDTILIKHEAKNPRLITRVKNTFKSLEFSKVFQKVYNKRNKKYHQGKVKKFKEFSNELISETEYAITRDHLPLDKLSHYDYFVVGSDQVWNPFYINGSSLYFLDFAPPAKRISYAASFGISSIPDEFKKDYQKYLKEMKDLAVREDQGIDIIKDLTGRDDAQVVVDPTMLLTKDKWREIAKPSSEKPSSPYLLTYFLGDVSNSTKGEINRIAKEKKLKIINLASLKDVKYYTSDPSEFVDFIDSAEIFCTDSFHGVVFSIILETPFIVYERGGSLPSMNSRIETLLSKFNLESRLDKNITSKSQVDKIDYSHVDKILKEEREKAFTYLKKALK